MKEYKSFARKYKLVAEPTNTDFYKAKIASSKDSADYLCKLYENTGDIAIVESFFILLLNQSNNITGWVKLSSGGLTGTVADPVLVAKYAIEQLAKNIIICHNHPSGNLKPSRADEEITQKIKQGLKLFDIQLLDHIILTEDGYYSFADEGIM